MKKKNEKWVRVGVFCLRIKNFIHSEKQKNIILMKFIIHTLLILFNLQISNNQQLDLQENLDKQFQGGTEVFF